MALSKSALGVVALAALFSAGCQSERFSSFESRNPQPLAPAPAGTVTSEALPPPGGVTDPMAFPTAPGTTTAAVQAPSGPPAGASDVSTASVAGVWNASVSGQSCKVATPQTKFGSGFRAGPLRCPAPLDGVKSWNVAGKQLTLYDETGGPLARLYSTSPSRFDGQTDGGLAVSLTR
jgi:hypothetical protein